MAPRAEVTFGRSLAYALEGMRPLLDTRTDPARRIGATWDAAHVETAAAWYVGAIGRAAAGLLAIAERAMANKRRRLVPAELAAHIW